MLTKLDEPPSIRWDFPNAMKQPWLGVILHYPNRRSIPNDIGDCLSYIYLLQGLLPPAANPWKELETKTEKKIPEFCKKKCCKQIISRWHDDTGANRTKNKKRKYVMYKFCSNQKKREKLKELKRPFTFWTVSPSGLQNARLATPKHHPAACFRVVGKPQPSRSNVVFWCFLQPLKKYPKPLPCVTWV